MIWSRCESTYFFFFLSLLLKGMGKGKWVSCVLTCLMGIVIIHRTEKNMILVLEVWCGSLVYILNRFGGISYLPGEAFWLWASNCEKIQDLGWAAPVQSWDEAEAGRVREAHPASQPEAHHFICARCTYKERWGPLLGPSASADRACYCHFNVLCLCLWVALTPKAACFLSCRGCHVHSGKPLRSESVMWMGQVPEIVLFVTEFVINPNGKSEVCILHEYMQRVLKVRPVYNFFECGKFKPISVLEESHTSFCLWLEVGVSTLALLGWIDMQGKDKEKCGADRCLIFTLVWEGMAQLFLLSLSYSPFPCFSCLLCSSLVAPDLSRTVCNKGLSVVHWVLSSPSCPVSATPTP